MIRAWISCLLRMFVCCALVCARGGDYAGFGFIILTNGVQARCSHGDAMTPPLVLSFLGHAAKKKKRTS